MSRISFSQAGVITGAEIMDGIGVRWRGYVRALEALDARLSGKELTREQERYMEKKRKG